MQGPQGPLQQAAVSMYCHHPVTPSPGPMPWYSLQLRAAYGAVAHALLCTGIVNGMTWQFFGFFLSVVTLTFDI